MTCYLSKICFIFEKEEGGFEYITEEVLNKMKASALHDEYRLLTYKPEITSTVKTLIKNVIPRYVYDEY